MSGPIFRATKRLRKVVRPKIFQSHPDSGKNKLMKNPELVKLGPQFLETVSSIPTLDVFPRNHSIVTHAFLKKNLKERCGVLFGTVSGDLISGKSHQDLTDILTSEGLQFVLGGDVDPQDGTGRSQEFCFASDSMVVCLYLYGPGSEDDMGRKKNNQSFSMSMQSTNQEQAVKIQAIFAGLITTEVKEGTVYVLKKSHGGCYLSDVPSAGTLWIPENYSEGIISKYNHLLEDIKADRPCGRLNIISGIPGTGKTFLVRSLLNHSQDVKFVIVRPEMMPHLTDPELIGVLLEHASEEDKKPFVFIMEDADMCLAERMTDNMSSISAVLNTSDGILGATLDLRIIATTNAATVEFDEALMRPGRLCTHISTDKLSPEQAQQVYQREMGVATASPITSSDDKKAMGFGNAQGRKGVTLAEVYKQVYTDKKAAQ